MELLRRYPIFPLKNFAGEIKQTKNLLESIGLYMKKGKDFLLEIDTKFRGLCNVSLF